MIEFLILDLSASLSLILLYIINKVKMKKLERKIDILTKLISERDTITELRQRIKDIKQELNNKYGVASEYYEPKIYYADTDSITRIGN